MKARTFIASAITLTFLLLACVVIVNFITGLFKNDPVQDAASSAYSLREVITGIVNEGLRAVLLCYIFPQLKGAGSSVLYAIKINLAFVAMIASLWLVGVYGLFKLSHPVLFVMEDSVIFILQGILSGIALHVFYKKQWIDL